MWSGVVCLHKNNAIGHLTETAYKRRVQLYEAECSSVSVTVHAYFAR